MKNEQIEKITVCQVMAGDEEGGLEKHFIEICNRLAGRYRVIAVAHEKYRDRFDSEVIFHSLDLSRGRRNPLVLLRLYRGIKKYHPDIVHAQANKAAYMVSRIKPFIRSRFVATAHSAKSNLRIYSGFDRVIAVSHSIADRIKGAPVDVVYNGIEPLVVDRDRAREVVDSLISNNTRPVVAAVGRLVHVKGFDVLIDAWKQVDANLLIVGDGPLHDKLESLVNLYGLEDRVYFAGHRDDVPLILSAADMVVISSRKEGFPYVLIEALQAERIVVSTAVSGAIDILPQTCISETNNAEALAEVLNRCLKDRNNIAARFVPVWKMAKNDLTISGMVNRISDIYNQIPLL